MKTQHSRFYLIITILLLLLVLLGFERTFFLFLGNWLGDMELFPQNL